jgi:hypothetical protein
LFGGKAAVRDGPGLFLARMDGLKTCFPARFQPEDRNGKVSVAISMLVD